MNGLFEDIEISAGGDRADGMREWNEYLSELHSASESPEYALKIVRAFLSRAIQNREHSKTSRYGVGVPSAPAEIWMAIRHSMPYSRYLSTLHWLRTRNHAKNRAKHKCALCASVDSLEVHHNTYDNRGYENESDGIVLCGNCHGKFHD